MLTADSSILVVVDVQEKLVRLVRDHEKLLKVLQRLIQGILILDVPVICTEQVPDKIGPTDAGLKELLKTSACISKKSFSAWGSRKFCSLIKDHGRKNIILAGIETHVCVYQTARDLLASGYNLHVAADGVSSRTKIDNRIGLEKIKDCGGVLTSAETVLFELLGTAENKKFREILRLIK